MLKVLRWLFVAGFWYHVGAYVAWVEAGLLTLKHPMWAAEAWAWIERTTPVVIDFVMSLWHVVHEFFMNSS